MAAGKVEQHAQTMLFAQPQPHAAWQNQELQALVVNGAYEELTGSFGGSRGQGSRGADCLRLVINPLFDK